MSQEPRLCLIDGSGYIFRAFYALPPMTRGDGTPVNAVYGFTHMLMRLIREQPATHMAVVFDAARRTFRNDTERLEKLFDLYTKMTAKAAATPARKTAARKQAST